ncbi:MAG: hypothetical protein Q8Q18_02210 [bacterium]|nr:hypothetical protein [bacterium]
MNTYDKIAKLPKAVREVASAESTLRAIEHIAKTNNLHIDEVGVISDFVGKVLFGDIKPKEFVPRLAEALEMDIGATNAIARELNEAIFYPIREELREVHREAQELEDAERFIPQTQPKNDESREDILNQIENPSESRGRAHTTKPAEPAELELFSPVNLADKKEPTNSPAVNPLEYLEEDIASATIENPTEMGQYIPKPKGERIEIPKPKVLEQKRTDTFVVPGEGPSHIERVNKDPYKESIK